LKIHFTNPPSPKEYRVSRGLMGGFGMAVNPNLLYPPIELAHVASVLERDGCQVSMFDSDAEGADLAGARAAAKASGADVFVFDSSSTTFDLDLELATQVREDTGKPVVLLGSQVTNTPEEVFTRSKVDFVVRGEPELAVRDLVRALASKSGASKANDTSANGNGADPFAAVAGISYRRGGAIAHTADREKIDALDELPFPARHLLRNDRYHIPGMDGPATTVKSSRGCALDCAFCGYTLAQGLRFRMRSAANVAAELEEIRNKLGIRNVVFRDPIFTMRKDRVSEICDAILAKNLDVRWQCETAVMWLDRPLLEKMAKAGCVHISLGVESANAEIQKKYCGNKLRNHDAATKVFDACREFGIETRAFCMIGFPGETDAQVEETIQLALRLDPDQVQFCTVTPYPGTPLYLEIYGNAPIEYSKLNGHFVNHINPVMSPREVESKIKEAYRRFYLRPHRLAREMRHPMRLANKVARYLTLFRARAPQA
jgi:radical SAM superfamily enzyme YgiQ (UPF0313 family)